MNKRGGVRGKVLLLEDLAMFVLTNGEGNRYTYINGEGGSLYTYIYTYIYMYVCMYVYINVHIYIYIYMCRHDRMMKILDTSYN